MAQGVDYRSVKLYFAHGCDRIQASTNFFM